MGYFTSDKKFIYLDAPYAEFYIPLSYFDSSSGFAEEASKAIRCIGIFNFGVSNGKSDALDIKTFNVPTWIELFVYESEDQTVDLPGEGPTQCKVLKYFKGNQIMRSTFHDDSSNAELFLNFILNSKLPHTIPYDKVLEIWRKNQEMNGMHFGVSSTILELVLRLVYRDANDPYTPFAKVIGKDLSVSQFDYTTATIREICQYASTFSAMTFEDMDSMITASLNRTRNKTPETESPVEKVIKM